MWVMKRNVKDEKREGDGVCVCDSTKNKRPDQVPCLKKVLRLIHSAKRFSRMAAIYWLKEKTETMTLLWEHFPLILPQRSTRWGITGLLDQPNILQRKWVNVCARLVVVSFPIASVHKCIRWLSNSWCLHISCCRPAIKCNHVAGKQTSCCDPRPICYNAHSNITV